MPVMDISSEELDKNPHLSVMKILSYMLFPKEAETRETFLRSLEFLSLSKMAEADGKGIIIDKSAIGLMPRITSDPYKLIESALKSVTSSSAKAPNAAEITGGQLAAQILLRGLRAHQTKPGKVSLTGLLESLGEELQKTHAKNARPRDLSTHWHTFMPVAHLWAASDYLSAIVSTPEGGARLKNWQQPVPDRSPYLNLFLSTAEAFREKGEQIQHLNGPAPLLLPGQTWKAPTGAVKFLPLQW